ncbi:uncharacterized protein [Symphalangus syndactylus]|uniref:uncharacterized protein n=1 Tax=Symphalangus syndactylus TaxID=9590 RepID=UPI003004ABDC
MLSRSPPGWLVHSVLGRGLGSVGGEAMSRRCGVGSVARRPLSQGSAPRASFLRTGRPADRGWQGPGHSPTRPTSTLDDRALEGGSTSCGSPSESQVDRRSLSTERCARMPVGTSRIRSVHVSVGTSGVDQLPPASSGLSWRLAVFQVDRQAACDGPAGRCGARMRGRLSPFTRAWPSPASGLRCSWDHAELPLLHFSAPL